MPRLKTVIIETENGPVLINERDFNSEKHKLAGKTETAIIPPAPPVGEPQNEPPVPVQMAVTKKGKKFFVVDTAGGVIEREGIDAGGYTSDADAWAAIMALSAPVAPPA